MRRPWRARLLELALWAALSVAIAIALALLSESLWPGEF